MSAAVGLHGLRDHSVNLPFAEPVTWHRWAGNAEDDGGNELPEFTDSALTGAVWPTVSGESNQPNDLITRGLSFMAQGVLEVTGLDQFTVRGSRYNVVGDPDVYHSPLTGTEVTHVQLLRRT